MTMRNVFYFILVSFSRSRPLPLGDRNEIIAKIILCHSDSLNFLHFTFIIIYKLSLFFNSFFLIFLLLLFHGSIRDNVFYFIFFIPIVSYQKPLLP